MNKMDKTTNLLFLTDQDCNPQNGGIERVVSTLASSFSKNYGFNCYLLYSGEPQPIHSSCFIEKFRINADNATQQIETLIKEKDISIVFSHYMVKANRNLVFPALSCLRKNGLPFTHVALYHSQPGVEAEKCPMNVIISRILQGDNIKNNIGLFLKQFFRRIFGNAIFVSFLKKKYLFLYNSVDRLVLLDDNYIPLFQKIIGVDDSSKFAAIPNTLPFPEISSPAIIMEKENIVLIVSRLEEMQKRISSAIKVWKIIEEKGCGDWKLIIVGDGEDRRYYERMVAKNKLHNVSFVGKQNSYPYYVKSSIFLMTSAYEGFPMVLLESLQTACVPIVYKNFASIDSLINHNVNGVLVEPNQIDIFSSMLFSIMTDSKRRQDMAINGLETCPAFSIDVISKQWVELFSKCMNHD